MQHRLLNYSHRRRRLVVDQRNYYNIKLYSPTMYICMYRVTIIFFPILNLSQTKSTNTIFMKISQNELWDGAFCWYKIWQKLLSHGCTICCLIRYCKFTWFREICTKGVQQMRAIGDLSEKIQHSIAIFLMFLTTCLSI